MNIETFYSQYQDFNKLSIDSRTVEKGDLFFAFSGENFNAAILAKQAIEKGAIAVIVEQKEFEDIANHIYYVNSTLVFLQDLAKFHRQQFNIPIIALTGSNGKTTTKELISTVLSQKFQVLYTQGNLNNHIGVPLTLLSIKKNHEIAVIEMGANHQKEIELLCQIAQPNVGYITNFGKAHLEGFGGFEGVLKGKSELYDFLKKNKHLIFYNNNDQYQKERLENYTNILAFGTKNGDYIFNEIEDETRVGLEFSQTKIMSNLTGHYNFSNLCAAMSIGLHFGVSVDQAKKAITNYFPTNMRSQIQKLNAKTLVLDTYNANPSSMEVSLKNFSKFLGSKTIIIGDMLELGKEGPEEHKKILELASELHFNQVICIGPIFHSLKPQLSFLSTNELIDYLKEHKINSENILLKASRGIALEKCVDFL